jgi:hypothetical protein
MTRELSEILSDMRNIVKPTIAKILKQINYENCGTTDKAEFETEFEMVLTLAEMANNQWIPCSERMPEEGKDVLITILWKDGVETVEKSKLVDVTRWVGLGRDINVVAWIPLPEPYQPKDGEKE